LVETREETSEAVRTIKTVSARSPAIDALTVLARKTCNAIVGVVATGFDAKTSEDVLVTSIGRISAVLVFQASATARHEATREIAAGRQADLTDPARAWNARVA
jgi:hypothetical protein